MELTNHHGLPRALVQAVKNDTYKRGDAAYTVTQLISPPQIQALLREHEHEIVEDVADRLWSLYGSSMHEVLERAALNDLDTIAEERFSAQVRYGLGTEAKVSGQADLIEVGDGEAVLTDWKNTSVYAVKNGIKPEWEEQLNYLAYLANRHTEETGIEVTRVQILAFCRDWRRAEAKRDENYPPVPAVVVPANLWPEDEIRESIVKRLREHEAARAGDIRPCTDEERWARDGGYAVMLKGRKSAKRVLPTQEKAEDWAANNLTQKDHARHYIEYRRPRYVRCEEFCPVAQWCEQWQNEQRKAA